MPESTQRSLTKEEFQKFGDPIISFDEQAFINEVLDVIVELHGSYTSTDQRLVKQLASFQRSFEIADAYCLLPIMHLQYTGSNGIQPHSWFRIRESAMGSILKIRKDLGIDIASREPLTKGKQAEGSPFNAVFKEESVLVRR